MKLREIVYSNSSSLFPLFALIALEKSLWVVEPYFFGLLLDEVVRHKDMITLATEKFYIVPFIGWAGIFIANTMIGIIRKIIYQKKIVGIMNKTILQNLSKSIESGGDNSALQFKAEITRDYIDFIKIKIPDAIEHLVWVLGSLIGLFLFDHRIGIVCILIIIPIYFIDNLTSPKILLTEKEYHDKYEKLFNIIWSRDITKISKQYLSIGSPEIRAAQLSAYNFGLLRLALFIIFVVVLYISFDLDHFTIGSIYTIVSYIWTFISAIETIPETRENLTRLQDLDGRDIPSL